MSDLCSYAFFVAILEFDMSNLSLEALNTLYELVCSVSVFCLSYLLSVTIQAEVISAKCFRWYLSLIFI